MGAADRFRPTRHGASPEREAAAGRRIITLAVSIVRGIGQGTPIGATAYVLGRVAWLATPTLVEHALVVAWAGALLSLALATSLTRRALRP